MNAYSCIGCKLWLSYDSVAQAQKVKGKREKEGVPSVSRSVSFVPSMHPLSHPPIPYIPAHTAPSFLTILSLAHIHPQVGGVPRRQGDCHHLLLRLLLLLLLLLIFLLLPIL